jgi:amidase
MDDGNRGKQARISRRQFLKRGVIAAASSAASMVGATPALAVKPMAKTSFVTVEEVSIAQLQAAMTNREVTSRELVAAYLDRIRRIDQSGPTLRSVIEVNPDAADIAAALDAERTSRGVRGPLHGIPILIKDNIDTADKMETTAGSIAMLGTRPAQDATVARKLREAGAVILGKTNLSEWANFRSTRSTSGWSGRGRLVRNPYALDRNPCGSSSGSGVAVAASLCAAALGTETDGSIVCPSSINGVVGIKPTVGLTSRAGVVPIAHSQDTIGPHGRTVADAAAVLAALAGPDPRDTATEASRTRAQPDYTRFLDRNGLRGARIGVARQVFFGYSSETDKVIERAIEVMRAAGATIVDPADIPTAQQISTDPAELTVLLYEFKADLNAYLATRVPNPNYPNVPPMRTLNDLIVFNRAIAELEMPYFGQELFEMAQEKGPLTEPEYRKALETARRIGGRDGIDAVMDRLKLDALVAPTGQPAWTTDLLNGDRFLGASSSPAAIAGYPLVSVPAGYVNSLPIGITFMGRAWSEPVLIRLAYAYEQAAQVRQPPKYLPTIELP